MGNCQKKEKSSVSQPQPVLAEDKYKVFAPSQPIQVQTPYQIQTPSQPFQAQIKAPSQPVQTQADDAIIYVDFYFADKPEIDRESVKLALSQDVKHFKKLVKNLVQFDLIEYQVIYDNKRLSDTQIFQSFWSKIDFKEVVFFRPEIGGS